MNDSASVDIQVTANVALDEKLTEIASGFLSLYQDPKVLFCIILAFVAAQGAHVLMRGYFPNTRNLTKAIACWVAHLVVGYASAHHLLTHMAERDKDFYLYFVGVNSLVAYYLLLWLATRWFQWPAVVQFLTLRRSKIVIDSNTGKPVVEMGDTVRFLRK